MKLKGLKYKKNLKLFLSILGLLMVLGLLIHFSLLRSNKKSTLLFCDFEKFDEGKGGYVYSTNSILLKLETKGLTNSEIAYSGKNSVLIDKKEFANLYILHNPNPDEAYSISILRKNGTARLVVQENIAEEPTVYESEQFICDTLEDGWGRLKIQFRLPPDYSGKDLNIYIWNPDKTQSYFDDFEINKIDKIEYPQYNEIPNFRIYIEDSELKKLYDFRERAFERGVLVSEEDSYVKALVSYEDKIMKAEIRLKGDWLDHLTGDKWSFRVKIIDDSWEGMCVFSLQTPSSRSYIYEWFIHKVLLDNDILTTRYGFVPVSLNNRSLGIYAYEEHFVKQLIESKKRREGPIMSFSEEELWNRRAVSLETNESYVYGSAVITPFKENQLLEDTVALQVFILAQNLLDSYRQGKLSASEVFDVDKFARYFAIMSCYGGYHGIIWHNIRFYYNPITALIEPIAFDCYSNWGIFNWGLPEIAGDFKINPENKYSTQAAFYFAFLSDSVFVNKYKKELEYFSKDDYIDLQLKKNDSTIVNYESLIRREFLNYSFDPAQIITHNSLIKSMLPEFFGRISDKTYKENNLKTLQSVLNMGTPVSPKDFPNELINFYLNNDKTITARVFVNMDVEILGFGTQNGMVTESKITIKSKYKSNSYLADFNGVADPSSNSYVYFKFAGSDKVSSEKMQLWPLPVNYHPRIKMKENTEDISAFFNKQTGFYEIKSGSFTFDQNVIIPANSKLVISKGVKIDLIKDAAFLCYSPVVIAGTKDQPVIITSSDNSANAFTVLKAGGKSQLDYVKFTHLNTLDKDGWTLTGSVCFFESDVVMNSCEISWNNCEDDLNIVKSDFLVTNTLFSNTFGDAFDSDFCTGIVKNCTFKDIGNDAIDFSTSVVDISNCNIQNCGDKGVSGGENSNLSVKNCKIIDCNIGIASKDKTHLNAQDCNLQGVNYGLVLLQKKPEYGPGVMNAENVSIESKIKKFAVEQGSNLIFNKKQIEPTDRNLKVLFY